MIKIFLKDSFLYTLSNVLTKGIGFIILPIYTSFFSPNEFGVLDMLLISGTILSIVVGLEIHQAVARFFPEAESFEEKRQIVSTSFWSILFFYLLFLIPALSLSPFLADNFFKGGEYKQVVQVALLSYGFNFLYYFANAQLRWQMKAKQNVIVSVIYSAISALGAVLFLNYGTLGMNSVFLSQIIGASVGLIFSVYFSKEYYGLCFDLGVFKKLTAFSVPLVFSTLTVYAMLYVDRFIINHFLSTAELGLYGFAYRIASVVGLLTMGTQAALTPIIYNKFKEKNTPQHIAMLFNVFIAGAVVLIAGLFLFSDLIVRLMASSEYAGSAQLIPWIAVSILFSGISNFAPGIFIEKKTQLVMYINFVSLFMNVVLGLILIKLMGLQGAVLATALCSFLYFFMYYFLGQKYYFIPFFWTKERNSVKG